MLDTDREVESTGRSAYNWEGVCLVDLFRSMHKLGFYEFCHCISELDLWGIRHMGSEWARMSRTSVWSLLRPATGWLYHDACRLLKPSRITCMRGREMHLRADMRGRERIIVTEQTESGQRPTSKTKHPMTAAGPTGRTFGRLFSPAFDYRERHKEVPDSPERVLLVY